MNRISKPGRHTTLTTTMGGEAGGPLGTRPLPSTRIETWRVNSRNMAQLFAAIYGSELLEDRWVR